MDQKKVEFKTPWFEVESEEFPELKHLQGKPIYRINIFDSAVIVAFTDDQKLLLVRQFRPASKQVTLELPGGVIDTGEAPEKAIIRELLEETGYQCRELQFVGKGRCLPDRVNSDVFIFFGRGAKKVKDISSQEDTEVIKVLLPELKKLLEEGKFTQLSVLGMILAVRWRLSPEELKGL